MFILQGAIVATRMDGKNINNKWCKRLPLITECWKVGKWLNYERDSQKARDRHDRSTDLFFVLRQMGLMHSLTRLNRLVEEATAPATRVLGWGVMVGVMKLQDMHPPFLLCELHFPPTLVLHQRALVKQVRESKVTFEVHHFSKYQSSCVSENTTSRHFYRIARAFGERFS